ncbi:suppressor of fused domain protein [Dysgonomonas sp. Marseille-P4677]|uniref:suppressor of fused domain protein n=1 Tax=Dysgonomonas sp. Marseille-P4677 TaxID=2364790 RepID=UPI001913D8E4|nr:suppressor of fused domain protein [Dysgonomonas sp. Marseille-P4677]MBK5721960.1 suppressor of fused domain protein [Dysgonomonas sp. Marseille-P4677]
MTQREYKNTFDEDEAVGWHAIDKTIEKIYGNVEPRHYAPPLHFMLGGEDPLDGVSIFDSENREFHRHLVSYGMSELYYNEEAAGGEFSKWGFEFTFRLKPFAEDGDDPTWVVNLMNNLARYVIKSGRWFEVNHVIPANGPIRVGGNTEIDIIGVAFTLDPELGKIQTPHGEVAFLQMVGLTSKEMKRITESGSTFDAVRNVLEEIKEYNPLMITDLTRR